MDPLYGIGVLLFILVVVGLPTILLSNLEILLLSLVSLHDFLVSLDFTPTVGLPLSLSDFFQCLPLGTNMRSSIGVIDICLEIM